VEEADTLPSSIVAIEGSEDSPRFVLTDRRLIYPNASGSLNPGDRLTVRYAGGGYGAPDRRDRDRVLADLRHGYITESAARGIYKLS